MIVQRVEKHIIKSSILSHLTVLTPLTISPVVVQTTFNSGFVIWV